MTASQTAQEVSSKMSAPHHGHEVVGLSGGWHTRRESCLPIMQQSSQVVYTGGKIPMPESVGFGEVMSHKHSYSAPQAAIKTGWMGGSPRPVSHPSSGTKKPSIGTTVQEIQPELPDWMRWSSGTKAKADVKGVKRLLIYKQLESRPSSLIRGWSTHHQLDCHNTRDIESPTAACDCPDFCDSLLSQVD